MDELLRRRRTVGKPSSSLCFSCRRGKKGGEEACGVEMLVARKGGGEGDQRWLREEGRTTRGWRKASTLSP
jgi:hypothetical protein